MTSKGVPYYFRSVDWERLVEEFPPPPQCFETVFDWSRERLREIQLRRLREQVQRAWDDVPFYRGLWREAGFEPGDLRSLEDLAKLPTYGVEDIRRSIDRRPPYGDYQGLDWPQVRGEAPARIYFSGGTTGRERPMLYTAWDREVGAIMTARALWLQGIRPGHTVINNFSFSLHNAAWIIDHALWQWLGCLPVTASTGNVTSTDRQLEIARTYQVDAFVGFGDYLVRMASRARELELDPRTDFAVKALATIGSPEAVEDAWGAPALDAYGFHEVQYVSAESERGGGLHLLEDAFIVEVVDVDTGEPVPDGELGDLVITCLYKTGAPQIRYNIRDLSRILPSDQEQTMRRMDTLRGRSDTMVKLRGINIWPEAVGAIAAEDPAATGEYFVYVEREGMRDDMTCLVELASGASAEDGEQRIAAALRTRIGVAIGVKAVPGDELARLTGLGTLAKMRRYEDRRNPAAATARR